MKKGLFVLSILFAFAIALPVSAATIQTGEQVSIAETEAVDENTYLAGGQVTVSGALTEDVVAAGGKIVLNGSVAGDASLAGGTVDIFEDVAGDVRIAGGTITIAESVSGDVVVFGGSVSILPGATVGGDVLAVGGAVLIDGTVNGDVRVVGGEIALNGFVAGSVDLWGGEKITLGEKLVIGGDFAYRAQKELEIPETASIGGSVTFKERAHNEVNDAFSGIGLGFVLAQFLIFAVTTLVVFFALPRFSRRVAEKATLHPWKSLGLGFIALFMVPIFAIILLVSVLGIFLGIIALVEFVLALLFTEAMLGIVLGAFIVRAVKKEVVLSWKWVLLGVVLAEILAFIPVVGWIAVFAFFLVTLGAIMLSLYSSLRTEHV